MEDRVEYILRIKAADPKVAEWYSNYSFGSSGDSGVDLYCDKTVYIMEGQTIQLTFGISCEMIRRTGKWNEEDNKVIYSEKNVAYFLMPRSSIAKTALRMSNSVGLIDAFYRGPIGAYVDNIKDHGYFAHERNRFFQIVAPDLSRIRRVEVVTKFKDESKDRGGGFGSTGK